MNIIYKGYTIKQQKAGFDLVENKISKPKEGYEGGNAYEAEIGYNMSLEFVFKSIIHLELLKNESVVDLRTFLKEYKTLKNELEELFKL